MVELQSGSGGQPPLPAGDGPRPRRRCPSSCKATPSLPRRGAQALAYAHAQGELYFIDIVYGLLLLFLALHLRVAPKYRDWTAGLGDSRFLQTIVFGGLILLTINVLSFPTAVWGLQPALRYHQSIEGWGSWFGDWVKREAVEVTLAGLVIWILYTLIRKSPLKGREVTAGTI